MMKGNEKKKRFYRTESPDRGQNNYFSHRFTLGFGMHEKWCWKSLPKKTSRQGSAMKQKPLPDRCQKGTKI